ncbi:MAG: guanylate kinase [Firmicutes bacterium]|nr:guanylate kinase [Bacillota bacterium]
MCQQSAAGQGALIVLSGPSGVGKGSVSAEVLRRDPLTRFSVSATTRDPRPGEIDGKSYYFLTKEEFLLRRAQREFLEWAEVYGNYYGTLRSEVYRLVDAGFNVILDIDTQGAANVRRLCPEAVSVFIMPPSLEELERRIVSRGTETPAALALRLSRAEAEMALAPDYDHVIVNHKIEQAADELQAIIARHRSAINGNKENDKC